MRRKPAVLAGIVIGLFALSGDVWARWYQVEIVAFRHLNGAAGEGSWEEMSMLPDYADVVRLREPSAEPSGSSAFRALGQRQMKLSGIERRLRQASAYQPIFSAGWRQPSFGVAGAKRVYLSDVGALQSGPNGENSAGSLRQIEGTVAVKISRLMHIEVDFLFNHGGQLVQLHETRKAKLREIHYFDHPLFGLIVQVSPFAVSNVAQTTETGDDEPEDQEPQSTP